MLKVLTVTILASCRFIPLAASPVWPRGARLFIATAALSLGAYAALSGIRISTPWGLAIALAAELLYGTWLAVTVSLPAVFAAWGASGAARAAGMSRMTRRFEEVYLLMIAAVFFSSGGAAHATGMMLASMKSLPPGMGTVPWDSIPAVLGEVLRTGVLLGLTVSLPVLISVLMINTVLGASSRLAPQIQAYFAALPLNALVLPLGLAATLPAAGHAASKSLMLLNVLTKIR